ncbi:transporter substrate-binding domain-containing protein [Aliiglaciecola sp. CAU 1673]|uniref:substrate-binding periplasmic protein n=1 Tax=Aliiglaciecola sp. CAU 1673 TaxID=3032595 RepID=UPI0023DA24D3|nr:transporter substrate-binding domain-containing protein [Aliiglaciecola sp. CAU 1673]MDF2178750.1 transporter substrate-binding domain-containing protein [Aliiglaciecola sp. CAU 1673]
MQTIEVMMKKGLLLLAALFLVPVQAQPTTSEADVVFVAEDLAPYHFLNAQQSEDGAMFALAKAVAKVCEIRARFELLPWSRAFLHSKDDVDVVMVSLLRTPEREPEFHWIGRVFKTEAYFVKLKSRRDIQANNIEQAKKYVVATIRGYGSEKWLRTQGFDERLGNLALSLNSTQLWGMLFKERAELVLTNTMAMRKEVVADGYPPEALEPVFEAKDIPTELFFATGLKTSSERVQQLSDCLNKTKQDGTYDAILQQWQLSEGRAP